MSQKISMTKKPSKGVRLDELGLRILEVIQTNARISFPKLSEEVGLSTSPCFNRVRKLEGAGLIKAYLADLNLAAIGPHVMVLATVILDKHDHFQEEQFRKCVGGIPEIVSAYQVSGPYDYQLLCVSRDIDQYQKVATQLFEAGVTNLQSHVILKTIKEFRGYPIRKIAGFQRPD